MLTVRHHPLEEFFRMPTLDRYFDTAGALDAARASAWVPAVDVYEDAEKLVFKVELPEVKKEDVSVRVADGVLTMEGTRQLENEEKRQGYHRVERSYGKFARSFALPESVGTDHVGAELKDGVLRVTLPKRKEALPRAIEIKA